MTEYKTTENGKLCATHLIPIEVEVQSISPVGDLEYNPYCPLCYYVNIIKTFAVTDFATIEERFQIIISNADGIMNWKLDKEKLL